MPGPVPTQAVRPQSPCNIVLLQYLLPSHLRHSHCIPTASKIWESFSFLSLYFISWISLESLHLCLFPLLSPNQAPITLLNCHNHFPAYCQPSPLPPLQYLLYTVTRGFFKMKVWSYHSIPYKPLQEGPVAFKMKSDTYNLAVHNLTFLSDLFLNFSPSLMTVSSVFFHCPLLLQASYLSLSLFIFIC